MLVTRAALILVRVQVALQRRMLAAFEKQEQARRVSSYEVQKSVKTA